MSNKQITEYEDVDVETLKKGFCNWVDEFLNLYKEPLETEMTDPDTRGRVLKIEDEDSLKYKFVTEFNFSINKVKKVNSEIEEDDDFEGMSITYKEKDICFAKEALSYDFNISIHKGKFVDYLFNEADICNMEVSTVITKSKF